MTALPVIEPHTLFVTRSLGEAICFAGQIMVMSPGPNRIVAKERITLEWPRYVSSPAFNAIRRITRFGGWRAWLSAEAIVPTGGS